MIRVAHPVLETNYQVFFFPDKKQSTQDIHRSQSAVPAFGKLLGIITYGYKQQYIGTSIKGISSDNMRANRVLRQSSVPNHLDICRCKSER